MKSILKYSVSGLAAMLLITGCSYKTSVGVSGVDISKTDMTKVDSMKTGESCQSSFLIFPTGMESTAREAAMNGGITTIEYQETRAYNYLIVSGRCITVYGK